MRSMLTATWMFVAAGTCANAQMTPPSTVGTQPKPVATIPVGPAGQTPAAIANATAQAERMALQSDLAWAGQYNGTINGEASERMAAAVKAFQKAKGGKPSGVLSPQERAALAETAHRNRDSVGWKIVSEPVTGARLGIPGKLVPQQSSDATGARWTSPTGAVDILLARRKRASPTAAGIAEQEKMEPGRKVEYSVVKPDFFVLSGQQGAKQFYMRGTFKGDEVRIMTILYDQAMASTIAPVVIAMSSAFNPFADGAQAASPPPRKTVEYGTGIVVGEDGTIVADRLVTDGCLAITIGGYGHADHLADDRDHDLALLRIYGARDLKPLNITAGKAKGSVAIVGIADPQAQGGGATVTSASAAVAPSGGSELVLSPPPGLGFSGAPAIDSEGRFAGIALLKPAIVAGPAGSAPTAQAVMVPAESVRDFLKARGVTAGGGAADARASVLRVICVRK